jgi:uncharacterized protein (TIGR03435 family)
MKRIVQCLLVGVLIAQLILAQSPAERPHFEVASVKLSGPQDFEHCSGDGPSPARLVMRCNTVMSLIQSAYGSFALGVTPVVPKPLKITGRPSWINSDRYDIEAKPAGNVRMEQMAGPMLQGLLEDRFQLKTHRETRELPVYTLTVATGGLKVQALKEACAPLDIAVMMVPPVPGQKPPNFCGSSRFQRKGQTMILDLHATSMTDLANRFSVSLDRTVIDKTGAAGIFDLHLEFGLDETTPGFPPGCGGPAASDEAPGPSIFTAVQELGLRLESAKGPVEFLVIDGVERPDQN